MLTNLTRSPNVQSVVQSANPHKKSDIINYLQSHFLMVVARKCGPLPDFNRLEK